MKIGALQGKNQEFNQFVELVGSITDTDLYTDQDFMMAHLNAYDAFLVDTSQEVHVVNKLVSELLEQNGQIKLLAVDNKGRNLNKLSQTYTEFSFHMALQLSMDKSEVIAEIEGHFSEQVTQTTRSVVLRVIQDHLEGDISDKAQKASDGLDSLFEEEFADENREKANIKKLDDSSGENFSEFKFDTEGDGVSDSDNDDLAIELSDDELDLDLGDDSPEDQVQDEEAGLELSLDDDIELNVEDNSADDVSLDDEVVDDFDEPTMITQSPDPSISSLEFNVSEEVVDQEEPSFSIEEENSSEEEGLSFDLGDDGDDAEAIKISDKTSVSQMFDLGAEDTPATEVFAADENLGGDESFDIDDVLDNSADDLDNDLSFSEDHTSQEMSSSSDSDNPLEELKTKILELDSILASDSELTKEQELPEEPQGFEDDFELSDQGDSSDLTEDFSLDDMMEDDEFGDKTGITDTSEETQVSLKASVPSAVNNSLPSGSEFSEYKQHHEDELLRLSETIKALRVDRDRLSKIVSEQEKQLQGQNDGRGYLQAEIDERKIEIEIIKKRHLKQMEDLGIKLELVQNKNEILMEQNKVYQREIEKLQKETSIDQKHKRSRERELEEKLELLKKDTDVQIRNRDHKILDLKRQIDSLEFDIESVTNRERKSQVQHQVVEDKMNKVIRTLRTVIGQVEEDNVLEERKKIIKKNLDV